MPRQREQRRDFPGKRWLNVGLRTAHIGGVVLLGASLFGQRDLSIGALITVASGLGMFAIDIWAKPASLRETAGFGILIKLALIGLMVALPADAPALFWLILGLSTVLSHAPGNFRHYRFF